MGRLPPDGIPPNSTQTETNTTQVPPRSRTSVLRLEAEWVRYSLCVSKWWLLLDNTDISGGEAPLDPKSVEMYFRLSGG
jgi:hypothetical protein